MELQLETLQLVRDVVSSADMKVLGHSFIFNEAAARLEESGASSLPAIEHVLIREVMPECPVNLSYIPFPFVGASSVLLCYFRVCKHTGLSVASGHILTVLARHPADRGFEDH